MKDQSKFLFCIKYDFKIVAKNKSLGGPPMETRDCSKCAAKVLVSKSSVDVMAHDTEIKPLCQDCAQDKIRSDGKPQYTMTRGQLTEAASILAKLAKVEIGKN